MQAKLQLQRRAFKEAEAVYRKLIALLPDNYEYHHGLCAALSLNNSNAPDAPLDAATVSRLRDVYTQLLTEYPDCAACKRIPLDFLRGADFAAAAKERIMYFVSRDIPSLFSDLKPLLRDPEKAEALWGIFENLLEESTSGQAVWLHLYLALHAAELGRIGDAIKHIVAAEERCSDCRVAALDVFSAKAEVLTAAGDAEGAAAAAEVARLLDVKDRYVNSMAAKYWFRAGHLQRARETALLFAVDIDGNVDNLNEMQVIWYELESGQAHASAGDLGMVCIPCRCSYCLFWFCFSFLFSKAASMVSEGPRWTCSRQRRRCRQPPGT
jgi:peptide alpha-N-acetyltransferase